MKEVQCPNCGCSVLQLRDIPEDDTQIMECGVCGYAEFKIEGEGWSFGGTGTLPSQLRDRIPHLREHNRGYGPPDSLSSSSRKGRRVHRAQSGHEHGRG